MFKYLSILLIFFSCSTKQEDCLEKFNNEIGEEYAIALEELTLEFDRNIMKSDGSNFAEKCRNFLTPLSEGNDQLFVERIEKRKDLMKKLTSLDTMIFNYGHIQNDSLLLVRHITIKRKSEYIKALSNLNGCSDLITEYISIIESGLDIGPVLAASGAVNSFKDEDFENLINKRILAVEILLPYLSNPE
ncbi:hypothetical protein [Algoriphagus sp. PAP.12]|uniref:hypothetical protein n=1 Tax=Algoriphagus sp. PAP.12 TaxID=2996678 RepID=UPI00227C1FE8|nr:hypothetical protein [Algoriphagus sp. PAP.12]